MSDEGVIDLAIAKISSADAGWRMVGDPDGQSAVTHWRKVKVRDGRTLVEFRPLTGRTHQIRVHAREAFGSGIVGDRVYGIPGGADAPPRVAAGGAARGQAGDRCHGAAAGEVRRMAR